jgi:hypothetical protein
MNNNPLMKERYRVDIGQNSLENIELTTLLGKSPIMTRISTSIKGEENLSHFKDQKHSLNGYDDASCHNKKGPFPNALKSFN